MEVMAMLIADVAAVSGQRTTKKLLAACGRENPTLGVGIRSFTSALIEELQAFGTGPFTVAMLHSRLITMRWGLAFTPVYALLSEHGGHSIELAPLPASALAVQPNQEDDESDFDEDMMHVSSPKAKMARDTRVLLAVSISDDATCDIAEWKEWLVSQTPLVVTAIQVRVEAVFKSHSTMLITSLPIVYWDCLPNNAAYRFIDFIKSGNLDRSRSGLDRNPYPSFPSLESFRVIATEQSVVELERASLEREKQKWHAEKLRMETELRIERARVETLSEEIGTKPLDKNFRPIMPIKTTFPGPDPASRRSSWPPDSDIFSIDPKLEAHSLERTQNEYYSIRDPQRYLPVEKTQVIPQFPARTEERHELTEIRTPKPLSLKADDPTIFIAHSASAQGLIMQ
ncbi:MAG: hypothetical protein Q9223_000871 [Gallowayella weberi]